MFIYINDSLFYYLLTKDIEFVKINNIQKFFIRKIYNFYNLKELYIYNIKLFIINAFMNYFSYLKYKIDSHSLVNCKYCKKS